MQIKPKPLIDNDVTPRTIYQERRHFMQASALVTMGSLLSVALPVRAALNKVVNPSYQLKEELTPFKDVTTYNNFYELGTGKSDPAKNAGSMKTSPWTLSIEGAVSKPRTFSVDDLLKLAPLEERIYRLRCVEAWSMVIPWLGYPLSTLLKQVDPLGSAKYVEFVSLNDPEQLPGQKSAVLDWPYREGLRMDEAMHPLTLLTLGLYGEILPGQNGAPVRIAVPWKYGFKSAKSIVTIRLTEQPPVTSWMKAGPREYGFYANVNPAVDHPRWSQAKERRIGDFMKRPTLPFNGYAAEVADLYSGMDLARNF